LNYFTVLYLAQTDSVIFMEAIIFKRQRMS